MSSHSFEKISGQDQVVELANTKGLGAHLQSFKAYQELYETSVKSPEVFWDGVAKDFHWFKPYTRVCQWDWKDSVRHAWFLEGKTNLAFNCLDRHLESQGDKKALIWEANAPGEVREFTYKQVHEEVGRLANALKAMGIKKGDRVGIYLGMVPELAFSLLACARLGAIHNVIFGGFSAESLKDRILDCRADFLLTADGLFRGAKTVALKATADEALKLCQAEGHAIKACLVLKRTNQAISMQEGRDLDWQQLVSKQSSQCPAESMDSEDPLFILYTSGSTGKPKGVLHTSSGYMVYTATTFKYIFAYQPEDIYWCTADIGWITGHSYLVYGPLLNGATCLMFEGVPTYPKPDRFWEMIARHRVTTFYTAPTAIRALMREGDHWPEAHDLSSLKLLGTVGEPINPEPWFWYFNKIGGGTCPIVDTWWQTETGGILLSTFPGAMPMKPGVAGTPFFGIEPEILDEEGKPCELEEGGYLCFKKPW
ncbi:MAG: acetate--CoA ligase, partial [Deltaproteobacteria bacterium]|nr:acetate--CoA ligase [Deltaproteobacteria bacterium]